MDSERIKQQVDLKITNQLYLHSPFAIFSTIFNTLVVNIVFYNIADPVILYGWSTISILYLMFRFFFSRYVLKRGITLNNLKLRLKQFTFTIFISGLIFGSAGILFLSADYPAYNSFIFFLMGGMFAGSLGAYAINQNVFYAFSAPVIIPVTIHSFILGGPINTAMSVMGIVFIIMMIAVVRRMNVVMIEAFTLGIENKQLAEKTRQLNTQLSTSNEKLRELSFKDTMTNVSNRRFVTEVLTPEVERVAFSLHQSIVSHKAPVIHLTYGIYIIDIDHFKDVNDTWGHKCGDDVIIQFVNIINSVIRKDDILCRWGGEEFVVILKRTDPNYIPRFAHKLINIVEATDFKVSESKTIKKTCSIGFSTYPFFENLPIALSLDETIEIADQALYYAKENGRNMAVLAEYNKKEGNIVNQEDVQELIKDIPKALQLKNITLHPNI